MPWRDRTGPIGYGPMTGRGLGPCGRGLAFRRGLGWRHWHHLVPVEPVNLTKEEEKKILEAELKEIETERQEIEKRLEELKK